MIKSPFDITPEKPKELCEEIDGAFSCQEIGCPSIVYMAKYFDESGLLTWKCEEGHINKIEDFYIG